MKDIPDFHLGGDLFVRVSRRKREIYLGKRGTTKPVVMDFKQLTNLVEFILAIPRDGVIIRKSEDDM